MDRIKGGRRRAREQEKRRARDWHGTIRRHHGRKQKRLLNLLDLAVRRLSRDFVNLLQQARGYASSAIFIVSQPKASTTTSPQPGVASSF
jgi:hypothetical protein